MDSPKIEFRKGGVFGGGLYAIQRISAGEIVAEFDGEFVEWHGTVLTIPNISPVYLRDHCIQYGVGKSRDSVGLARYANHSCDPNCGIKNLFQIVAMRDIQRDEEILWDYAMSEDNDWLMTCLCGSPLCRKIIGGYRFLPPERRKAYEGYISSWLLEDDRPFLGSAIPPQLPPVGDGLGTSVKLPDAASAGICDIGLQPLG